MSAPRRSRRLAGFVLAWFALWLGVTLASPMVGEAGLQLVCSGTSFKLVSGDQEAPANLSGHLGQCPACAQPAAPPPVALGLPLPPGPVDSAPPARMPLRPSLEAAAPPAARGPPAFS